MVVVAGNLKHRTWPFGTRDALHLSKKKKKTSEKVHLCFRLIKPITITNRRAWAYITGKCAAHLGPVLV